MSEIHNAVNAGDSSTITRAYLDSLQVEMRHIDAVKPSTQFELYGYIFETPIMMAALSHLDKTRPQGMVEAAKGMLFAVPFALTLGRKKQPPSQKPPKPHKDKPGTPGGPDAGVPGPVEVPELKGL